MNSKLWLISGLATLAVAMTGLSGCKKAEDSAATGGTQAGSTAPADTVRPAPTAEGNKMAGETIKLGCVASLTGDQKPWGDDSAKGAKLAVDELNAAGGIGGKKIELLTEDSASKPDPAKTAAEKLISDGVLAIVGEVASGHTELIARTAYEKGVPVVSIGSTKTTITDIGTNVFRVCYTDDFQGPVMAQFAYDEQGMREMAIITDRKAPYSQGLSASFKTKFESLGGKIVAEQAYQTGETQFQGILSEIKAKNPQGIFLSGYFPEVGPIASQARQAGITAKFFGGDGWDSPTILQSGGDAILGGFLCNHYNNKEDRPEVGNFLTKYKAISGGKEPGTTMAALGYDAALVVIDALKRLAAAQKEFNSKNLIEEIENTVNMAGVSGNITLKGMKGNPPKRALVVEVRPMAEGFQVFRKAYEYADVMK
ncbi:MAG: ABC transporter substrate-binding protein [Chthonomonas sp.]|nr:ABC transporter substrate-binding protein [Chthonomonas sp.]